MLYGTDMKGNNWQNVQQTYAAKHLYHTILANDLCSVAIISTGKNDWLTSCSGAKQQEIC